MASCSDFLDKEPLDQGTDAIMFKSPEQFDQAALALYSFPDWKSANYDGGLDVSGIGGNGGGTAPQSHGTWNGCYSALRNINILLEKAAGYSDQDAIASSHQDGKEKVFIMPYTQIQILKR